MILTVHADQLLQIAANVVVIVAGLYGFWRFLRRKLHEPRRRTVKR